MIGRGSTLGPIYSPKVGGNAMNVARRVESVNERMNRSIQQMGAPCFSSGNCRFPSVQREPFRKTDLPLCHTDHLAWAPASPSESPCRNLELGLRCQLGQRLACTGESLEEPFLHHQGGGLGNKKSRTLRQEGKEAATYGGKQMQRAGHSEGIFVLASVIPGAQPLPCCSVST